MFAIKRTDKVSKGEFKRALSCPYFAGGPEDKNQRERRVEAITKEVFEEFDKDRDGALKREEFLAWANQAFETTLLLDLFKAVDRQLTSSRKFYMESKKSFVFVF
jgi:Ca2+-binding EF-hand superfamily protein